MSQDDIFKFVNVRPVLHVADKESKRLVARMPAVDDEANDETTEDLLTAAATGDWDTVKNTALTRLDDLELDYTWLQKINDAAYAATISKTVPDAKKAAATALGKELNKLSEDKDKIKTLWSTFYSLSVVPEQTPELRQLLQRRIRALHFLVMLNAQKDTEQPLGVRDLDSIIPVVPKDIFLPRNAPEIPPKDTTKLFTELEKLRKWSDLISTSVQELRRISAPLSELEPPPIGGIGGIGGIGDAGDAGDLGDAGDGGDAGDAGDAGTIGPVSSIFGLGAAAISRVSRRPKFFLQDKESLDKLSDETKAAIVDLHLSDMTLHPAEIASQLERKRFSTVTSALSQLNRSSLRAATSSPDFQYLVRNTPFAGLTNFVFGDEEGTSDEPFKGRIQPLGVGDLFVVRQELIKYEAGEVAHIENVMKGESKKRTDKRIRESEDFVLTENEESSETERDLQTTDRFELRKETQSTIENSTKFDAGVSVTASYGPVSTTAHADFALSQTSSDINQSASTYAKDVIEKSVSKIVQKTKEQRTKRVLERYEEVNEHGLDNTGSADHAVGIYRWVDKYYKARLINYGRRMMFEFVIPEPAAFFLAMQSSQKSVALGIKKPEPPRMSGGIPLKPNLLEESNYEKLVAKYNVSDVKPYPAPVIRVSAAFAEGSGTENAAIGKKSVELVVPDGYKCIDVYGQYNSVLFKNGWLDVSIAGEPFATGNAYNVEKAIPVSLVGWAAGFYVNLTAMCEVKYETVKAWQLNTFNSIMAAYQKQLDDYNEAAASSEIQRGVAIQGRPEWKSRKIERDELKKGALRLLTDGFARTRVGGVWRFDEEFDSMSSDKLGYPEFTVAEAGLEGKIIQFFEQSFEWDNMTYRFYGYNWARKSKWPEIYQLTDNDQQFEDFVRAGAARVVIPVRPAYNEAILHYLSTNEIWNGGDVPTLDDPLYVSIVSELKEATDVDPSKLPACSIQSGFPCIADEWTVKLPTSLVLLQKDATLPVLKA